MIDYNTYTDDELLILLKEDKPIRDYAFEAVYTRYANKLNSYCIFISRNKEDSKQLFQRTWIKFFEYAKDGNTVNNILSFLIITSKNIYLNDVKFQERNRKKFEEYHYINDIEEKVKIYDHLNKDKDLIGLIHIAVESLDEIYKEPFILKRFQGLPNEEIAKICNESIECVRKRITRATNMVKEIVTQYTNESNNIR
jgi:RNA polymerase sigma factor (sigma-70 family)